MPCRFQELDDLTCTVVGPYILRVVIVVWLRFKLSD